MKTFKLGLALLVTSFTIQAVEFTYTENDNSGNNIALGFPVPLPMESLTPVDGFRTFNSLNLRHQQLAAESPYILGQQIGETFNNRAIMAYQLSDQNDTTHNGEPEGSALINGGIHAREWQTPEAVTGYMETLFAGQDDQHINQYLLENLNLVVIPVLNIDGFIQTQRFPETVTQSEAQPRDGRMRRKNMRNVDESLSTTGDNLGGIDLNRNNAPYWATNPDRSSDDVNSIVHHGSGPASEPETQALQQAAVFAGEDRLRFYTDTHSFTQVYFAPSTTNDRRNTITGRVANTMRAVNGHKYRYSPSSAGGGIGATDEYFANTYQIPSYTLEIEPADSTVEYGGFGVSHDGFILPNAEVDRMRKETAAAAVAGLYMISAQPFLQTIKLSDDSGTVIEQGWQLNGDGTRTLEVITSGELQAGSAYQLSLVFNKPMRAIEGDNTVDFNSSSQANGMGLAWLLDTGSGESDIAIDTSEGQWLTSGFNHYKTDTYQVTITMPSDFDWSTSQLLSLKVNVVDMVGQQLDTNPATVVDWQNGHWINLEDTAGESTSDLGGVDQSMRLIDDGRQLYAPIDPGPAPEPEPPTENGGGSSGGGSLFWLLGLLAVGLIKRK
ncbi:zinc carboxypeptidase [Thalassotalea sp. M1531]|uniref:Zinc carboxypeptidase n=1 Tax=Thalassotalea algicola TaxID=2716224 RepID=A0A7Y0Q720_9GAMM|nr:M14 family zinc carboxypeptidase [Thalassotalea algicola]NMP31731.1 zinc carboxypeptidase [Thalassotalea algicola]